MKMLCVHPMDKTPRSHRMVPLASMRLQPYNYKGSSVRGLVSMLGAFLPIRTSEEIPQKGKGRGVNGGYRRGRSLVGGGCLDSGRLFKNLGNKPESVFFLSKLGEL